MASKCESFQTAKRKRVCGAADYRHCHPRHMGCAGSVESADREAVGGAGSNLTSNASHEATLAAAAIGGALGTFSMVDLSIAAKGLVSLDLMSASDPICVVYERRDGRLVELGRTEAICT